MRLQKFLAHAGVASRRASERLITEGRVSVNGQPVTELGARVDADHDEVSVDNVPVQRRRVIHVALNKPPGYVCTRSDPEKRRTTAELLPKEWQNLYPVGRLDRDSEGLLLLTNDGDFCLKLTHPRYGIRKTYVALVTGRADPRALPKLVQGIRDRGESLKAEKYRLVRSNNSHSLIEVEMREGKNHEVRRLLAALGLPVEQLRRIQIGPIRLGELPAGKWRVLTESEVQSLMKQVSPSS